MARELTTAGARVAYVPEALPAHFEDQEPTDFSSPAYENLRNCASGLPALFDRHVREAAAVKSDPQWREFSQQHRQQRISEAVAKVRDESVKALERLEGIADSVEKEASDLHSSLLSADRTDSASAADCVNRHQALPREKQVTVVYDLSQLLEDSAADPAERKAAREYLSALAATDQSAHLLDDGTRKLIVKMLARSRDRGKYQHARHLALASRAIKESVARVRELVTRQ
jgi:hypothetical protein